VKYAFILAELLIYPLSVVCWILGVTASGFHAWRTREPSARDHARQRLCADIKQVFEDHRGRYGAPRLYRVLRSKHGYAGSLNRIKALMRAMGLRAKAGRKFKVTTDSNHALPIAPNLLGQDFSCDTSAQSTSHAKAPDQVWLSDITYLWTREGWLYVCAVLDLFTRKIVGWAIDAHMTRELVLDALRMAVATRQPASGLIFHSDRGCQYASHEVRDWLAVQAMQQSMSGTGNCYERAACPRGTMRRWRVSGIRSKSRKRMGRILRPVPRQGIVCSATLKVGITRRECIRVWVINRLCSLNVNTTPN
jgi:putative transposase